MAVKLTKAQREVLESIATQMDEDDSRAFIPARYGRTLWSLGNLGMVEFAGAYLWRITPAGREALKEGKNG